VHLVSSLHNRKDHVRSRADIGRHIWNEHSMCSIHRLAAFMESGVPPFTPSERRNPMSNTLDSKNIEYSMRRMISQVYVDSLDFVFEYCGVRQMRKALH